MSTGRAEIAAIAMAAPRAGRDVTWLIDNLAVATRMKALTAWAGGRREEAIELVPQAEDDESLAEESSPEDQGSASAATAQMRHVAPALLHRGASRAETGHEDEAELEDRLIPKRGAEYWAAAAEHAAWTQGSADVVWVPSHMLDKEHGGPGLKESNLGPPMASKLAKARKQANWKDSYLALNGKADDLATSALRKGGDLHAKVDARAESQARLSAIAVELMGLAAKRLCAAKLPKEAREREGD